MLHLVKHTWMNIKEKIKNRKTKESTRASKNNIIASRMSFAELFGINKKEIDGLAFQKKVRNEWQ